MVVVRLERMETYFKSQLSTVLGDGHYDPSDENDRSSLVIFMLENIHTFLHRVLKSFKE